MSGGEGLLGRFRKGLAKTREILGKPISEIVSGGDRAQVFRDLEAALVTADVGIDLTMTVLEELKKNQGGSDRDTLLAALRTELLAALPPTVEPVEPDSGPRVVFFVGVNGTGKTTTIGKHSAQLASEGKSPLLAACDTFRAAAIDQLAVWSDRAGVPLVKQGPGADPAAVLHDALSRARERGESPVLVDTAGRLQSKGHLMDELAKMGRIADRLVPGAPHDCWLVLDATTGQNGLSQAREFSKAIPVTGIVLTKLDGTAKGGIALAIAREFGLPIAMVGVGEGVEDIIPFSPEAYVDGLLGVTAAAS